MARCPFALWRPLPQNASQPPIVPTAVALHTAVDAESTTSLYNWQSSPGAKGAESHFYVSKDGVVEQYIDTDIRADAQFQGNSHVISVETWDGAATSHHVGPLNAAQLASVIKLFDWACRTHGIPRVLCPTPDGGGIGYHSLFPVWNKDAHACPGVDKVDQVRNVIIPALNMPVVVPVLPPKRYDMQVLAWKNPDGTFSPEFAVFADSSVPQLCKKRAIAAGSDAQFVADLDLAPKDPKTGRYVVTVKDRATIEAIPNA